MDHKTEVREFLATRRARITPDRAGLPAYGGNRRVPGLRREEVAMLAGMSVDYYTRLERGNLAGVSESVLESLARALQLDEAEHAHLFDLARTANTGTKPRARRNAAPTVRPAVQRILDSMQGVPAFIRNGRLDVLAANTLGEALYSELYANPARPVNHARFAFLDPRATRFWADWDRAARDTVAILRSEAGRHPYDRALTDLVGELSTRSDAFRTLWASHDVKFHRTGAKTFNHPVVGPILLDFEAFELPADDGLTILAYSAEPGTAASDSLALLASWAATRHEIVDPASDRS
ncbi:helix-turn-helix transcriptional regulator [Agromyces sp. SYSU K20354]|uniref:helix-turn-helix transcriptional regulator n=1 Tax=Agromyces cavernae TaxID=2898659 RepID=UPI001E46A7A6|nr:helix-turn-helix transcriptional regulator [Agromyces cavernae]MCD2440819.1 helix-turn-helix transcriptional regulator [Agromyces cavernae]